MHHHHYLIAEDDRDTQTLIRRAYKNLDLAMPVHFVEDGDEAIEYLAGQGPYADHAKFPIPALTLLDLKMPRKTGLEVLRWIRQSPHPDIIVVMFTSSDQESDVREAYRLCANSFVHKPVAFSEFQQTLSSIHHYWFGCNYFPSNGIGGKERTRFKVVRVTETQP